MAKAKKSAPVMSHSERMAADTAAILQDVINAGGQVNIRFDTTQGPRIRVNIDRVKNAAALPLYQRYRHARPADLFKAASALILEHMPTE